MVCVCAGRELGKGERGLKKGTCPKYSLNYNEMEKGEKGKL